MTINEFLDMFPERSFYNEPDGNLTRKKCAEIIHLFLQKILREKDEIGIEKAYFIKDLFDCRVCANHIAQVYLKGIMFPRKLAGDLFLFEPEKDVDREDAKLYIQRALNPEFRPKA